MKFKCVKKYGSLFSDFIWLTEGKIYEGGFVTVGINATLLNIVVFDNKEQWNTYHPEYFIPYKEEK